MAVTVIRADARRLPLPDASADLIVTSPPYFGLRSYTDAGEHYDGQIGSEDTPQAYLEALWDCTREWARVLKPGGSMFINLGDKYAGSASGGTQNGACGKRGTDGDRKRGHIRTAQGIMPVTEIRDKSLLGMPWRYAIGCTDRLGLILRAEIIWAKPNGLPESVTDRVRRSHEQVFHFTRQPRYYTAIDEIREPHTGTTDPQGPRPTVQSGNGVTHRTGGFDGATLNPLGKLPGSVWTIPSAPLTVPPHLGVDHFAAFHPALVRPVVLGWSPPGVCTACGQGRRPVSERVTGLRLDGRKRPARDTAAHWSETACADNQWGGPRSFDRGVGATITGYACGCPDTSAPTRPALVVDPFGGTGTTALVASVHGRHGVSVDLSADYCRLAAWRTRDPGERARALDVPKPPPVPDGQDSLFDLEVP
jgi:DNA modification methylase